MNVDDGSNASVDFMELPRDQSSNQNVGDKRKGKERVLVDVHDDIDTLEGQLNRASWTRHLRS